MANIELSQLIANLTKVRDKCIEINLPQIRYIYSLILSQMAEHTVYDTTQMRAGIVKAFFEKFGLNQSDINEIKKTPLNYWQEHGFPQNKDRGWDNANTSMSERIASKKYKVKIKSQDEALYLYETGNFNISNNPDRDNSNFTIMPISYVADLVNYGFTEGVKDLGNALSDLIDDIIIDMIGR